MNRDEIVSKVNRLHEDWNKGQVNDNDFSCSMAAYLAHLDKLNVDIIYCSACPFQADTVEKFKEHMKESKPAPGHVPTIWFPKPTRRGKDAI